MSDEWESAILYTQTGCADSRKVRNWLTARGDAFVERNVTGNLDTAKELYATGIFATPLLVVGDEKVLGFRPDKLAAALSTLPPEESADVLRSRPARRATRRRRKEGRDQVP